MPALGSVPAQGLTLDELRLEIEERYAQVVEGLGVTPVLRERAERYVFVLGEVKVPGRYTLTGPTFAHTRPHPRRAAVRGLVAQFAAV